MLTLTVNIQWDHPEKVWLLRVGGRLPLVFPQVSMVFVDRNVVSRLRTILRAPATPDSVSDAWWLRHLDRPDVRLNPALFALEGDRRRTPTTAEFASAIRAASDALRAFFGTAQVVDYDEARESAMYGVLRSLSHRRASEREFVREAVPLVASRVARGRERVIEDNIVNRARAAGIAPKSAAVLAVLSVLYETPDGSEPRIGRGILKPRKAYTTEDAYNAVADLQALDFLIIASALTGGNAGFLTYDRSLLNLWLGLGVHAVAASDLEIKWKLAPTQDLLPRLVEEERIALVARLDAADAS